MVHEYSVSVSAATWGRCPFCRGRILTARVEHDQDRLALAYRAKVRCAACGATGPWSEAWMPDQDQAVESACKRWKRRMNDG